MEEEREHSVKERLLSCLEYLKQKNNVQSSAKNAIHFANVSSALRQEEKLEFLCHAIYPESFVGRSMIPQELGDIYISGINTIINAFSNSNLLQKALLTVEVECGFDNNNNNNNELINENWSQNTHVNVRKRWIRCVLSLSSSEVNILPECTAQSQSVEECVNNDIQICLVSLRVRAVKICTQDALYTLECTASANNNGSISANSALGSFEAIVAKSEMQLAEELISTLHELSCLLRSKTKTIVHETNLLHVDVPVYLLHIQMCDSAATRLCEVGKYTNNMIDYFTNSIAWCEHTNITNNSSSNSSCSDDTLTINNKLATRFILHWNTHVLQLVYELSRSFSVRLTNTSATITNNKEEEEEEWEEYTSNREQCAECIDVLLETLNSVMEMYNNTISTNYNASRNVMRFMQNMWALLNTHFTNEQLHVLHPPSVLVHCVQGISRSPSIILLYLLHRLQEWHNKTCKAKKCIQQLDQNYSDTNTTTDTTTTTTITMKVTKEQIESVTLLDCLEAMRSVRSCVQPNIAFMMELQSLWRHSFHE